MMNDNMRLPAEWEPVGHVLMAWPHAGTDWAYMLAEVRACFIDIVAGILPYADVIIAAPDAEEVKRTCSADERLAALIGHIKVVTTDTNDTWARDFGFITTLAPDGRFTLNDFKFNGWGLKFASCHDNLINRAVIGTLDPDGRNTYRNLLNFVLEGGSVESDGAGTILTTSNCLLSPNRNGEFTKSEIDSHIRRYFGADRVLWVDHGDLEGDDTDSHIDTLARLLPDGIIACTSCDRPDDSHYDCLGLMVKQISGFRQIDGSPYRIVELPIPAPIYDEDGLRLPATYANFLIVNNAVLLPIYADEHYDAIAIEAMRQAMPGYTVIPVDCRALIKQHGSLHCMTMQIPDGVFHRHMI